MIHEIIISNCDDGKVDARKTCSTKGFEFDKLHYYDYY